MKSANWVNFVLGIWLIIAPWVWRYSNLTATGEDIILGILVALAAIWAVGTTTQVVAAMWTQIVLAIWIFIAPWVLRYSTMTHALANDMAVAVVIAIVAASASRPAIPAAAGQPDTYRH
jgi:hypothetical protein